MRRGEVTRPGVRGAKACITPVPFALPTPDRGAWRKSMASKIVETNQEHTAWCVDCEWTATADRVSYAKVAAQARRHARISHSVAIESIVEREIRTDTP